jgi:hypothetical protein
LALANFILRPIVLLQQNNKGQFIVLWQTNSTSEQDIPVSLIATDNTNLHLNNLYIHHYDLYEPLNVSEYYQHSMHQLKQNWIYVQDLRKVESNRILIFQWQPSAWTDTQFWNAFHKYKQTLRLFFVGGGGTNQEKLKQRLIELGTQFYNSPWNLNALYQDVLVCMEQLNWIQFPENSQQIVEHIDLELTQETENAIEELVVNAEDKRKKFGQQIFEQVGYYQKKNYSEMLGE